MTLTTLSRYAHRRNTPHQMDHLAAIVKELEGVFELGTSLQSP
jgi:hypothetical protein